MKIDDREIRSAMDRRLSALDASAKRRARIRSLIGQEEKTVKKKWTASMAVALVLTLVLTGAALAVGVNLFEYFGTGDKRLEVLADQAMLDVQIPQSVATEQLGTTVGIIHNAYYDGRSLLVAYSIENGRRVEAFMPTEEQLKNAELERIEYLPLVETEEEQHILDEYVKAREAGEPCGLAIYTVDAGDHSYANGIDLGAWNERGKNSPDGVRYTLREYVTPLPEAVQDQETLELEIRMKEHVAYLYFDGEASYVLRGDFHAGAPAASGTMTATVSRTEAKVLNFTGTGMYNGVEIQAAATVSAAHGEITLTGTEAFPVLEDGAGYELKVYDAQGGQLSVDSMAVNHPDRIDGSFRGIGEIPESLSVVICVEGDGGANSQSVAEPIEMKLAE